MPLSLKLAGRARDVPETGSCILLPLLCLLALLLFPGIARGQASGPPHTLLPPITAQHSIRMPRNIDSVSFYLITVDVGNRVWDNFGHTALRVIDEESNTDLVFNWGLFDLSVGPVAFASNFMLGIMDYQLGVMPPNWEFGRYQQEERTIWQDRINLTRAQKETLYKRLAWNIREENLVYAYDYFFDNCTTRVRDYLNEALQGVIAEQRRALVQRTYRDEVRAHYASLPPISLSLDVLMNSNVDRRMTQWEQMFLPLQLRAQLKSLPSSVYENGRQLPLLDNPQVVMQFVPPSAKPDPYYFVAALALPLLLLLLSLRRSSLSSFSSTPGLTLKAPGLSFRVLGLLGALIALVSGIYGCIMLFGWLFSGHEDLHHNPNLLLFWPTDLLGFFISLRWLLAGQAVQMRSARCWMVRYYMLAHIIAALIYVIVGLTGLVAQEVLSIVLYAVPTLLLFTIVVWSAGIRPVRSIRFG
jgi:hypothetical protein